MMLKLALPNGSLQENTLRLFAKAGMEVKQNGRCAHARIEDPLFKDVLFTRPQAIPRLVGSGICDVGICGKDCFLEYGRWVSSGKHTLRHPQHDGVYCVCELPYSKRSLQHSEIVLIGGCESKCVCLREVRELLHGQMVYSEYPEWTKKFLAPTAACVIHSPGSTEAHVPLEFPFGICMTETGETIKENGLRIIAVLEESPVVLIINSRWMGEGWPYIRKIADRLTDAFSQLKQEEQE